MWKTSTVRSPVISCTCEESLTRQMSQGAQKLTYPWGMPQQAAPAPIVPTVHDVLNGRGVNIAQHPGNERFRALVNSRYDADYCTQYTTTEKRAVAREIVEYIRSLDPPGRFLKRAGRSKNSRGLEGPWEELTEQESIKKACQALRDCNRQDRSGYAAAVEVPPDVRQVEEIRLQTGLSNKEYAEQIAAAALRESNQHIMDSEKWNFGKLHPHTIDVSCETLSPSIGDGTHWSKKQRIDHDGRYMPTTTPTTAASSSGMLGETSLLDSGNTSASSPPQIRPSEDHTELMLHHKMPSSPVATPYENLGSAFHNAFHSSHLTDKIGMNPASELDPLALAASNEHFENHSFDGSVHDFGPPSPLHDQQNHHPADDIVRHFD